MANKKKKIKSTKKEQYAYTLTDRVYGELNVLNTANGWWLDRGKLENLISAFKFDNKQLAACAYAGISLDQLIYFRELHPEFSHIIELCKQVPQIAARRTIVKSLETDVDTAKWYLERKCRDEFATRTDHTSDDKPIKAVVDWGFSKDTDEQK